MHFLGGGEGNFSGGNIIFKSGGGASVNFQSVAHFLNVGLYISGAAYFIWRVSGGCKFFQGVAHILCLPFFSAVGARYVSISSYQASRDDELSFVRGAVVKVIKKYVDGWWLVR